MVEIGNYTHKKFIPRLQEPFEKKVEDALRIVEVQLKKHPYGSVVGCSFGKDSLVVLDIVRKYRPEIPIVFANTLVQHPETYKYRDFLVKEWNLNLIETKPIKTFWEVASQKGLDDGSKKNTSCCWYLKEKPTMDALKKHGFTCMFDGLTIVESRHRMFTICRFGMVHFAKRWKVKKVHPIAFWLEQDIWKYIKENNLPYNPIYDNGHQRSGCFTCTSFKRWKEEMRKHFPKLYEKIQEK